MERNILPHSYPRDLTEREHSTTRWLIENAQCSGEDKKKYLAELEEATVIGMCECGCASIDFAISGVASDPTIGLDPFGDYFSKDREFGIFVFSRDDHLAGVEIYTLAAEDLPSEFPDVDIFEPAEWGDANQSPQTRATSGPV